MILTQDEWDAALLNYASDIRGDAWLAAEDRLRADRAAILAWRQAAIPLLRSYRSLLESKYQSAQGWLTVAALDALLPEPPTT